MKLLILGGTGFIGNRLAKFFSIKTNWIIETFGSSNLDLTDFNNIEILRQKITPDTVILFCSTISRLKEDSFLAYSKNISMVYHVALSLSNIEYHSLIFCSSMDVYGRPPAAKLISENADVNPFRYYGLSKFVSEKILINEIDENKLSILRLPGVYSLDEQDPSVLGTIFNNLKENIPIKLSGGGEQYRAYINITELALVIENIILRKWSGLLNAVFSHATTLREMSETMKCFLLSTSPIIETMKNGTEFDILVDTSKICAEFPTITPITLEQYLIDNCISYRIPSHA